MGIGEVFSIRTLVRAWRKDFRDMARIAPYVFMACVAAGAIMGGAA